MPSRTAHAAATPAPDPYWTGLPPIHGLCPGVTADGTMCSLPQVRLDASRQEMLNYFNNTWTLTELLFSGLASNDAYFRRPYHQLRHPMIFYYAHPAVLYVNKLRVAGVLNGPVDTAMEALFEVGVDEMRWDDLHDGSQDIWPSVEAVRDYRRAVYATVREVIETHPLLAPGHLPITQQHPLWALVMGFEHERIHLETSSVLIRELPLELVRAPVGWPALAPADSAAPTPVMRSVQASNVIIGKPAHFPTFGWDNEYGAEERHASAFEAQTTLISNAEFLAFVKAGGYLTECYWSREGWAWRRFRNLKHPTFWVPAGPDGSHLYCLRTIFSEVEMPHAWPAIVNYHEAKAYCAWRSEAEHSATPYRLLTEAEHHALRDDAPLDASIGQLTFGSEAPVTHAPANAKGFHDLFGNLWQWCEDHFHPLPGAAPHPYYADFSAPCYDGEHQMILGGSFISSGDEASIHARFHFRPHFFQQAGFRVVRSLSGNPSGNPKRISTTGAALYESDDMLGKYLLMHFGRDEEIFDAGLGQTVNFPNVVNLPLACAALVNQFTSGQARALDLGCAVGRASFELARTFDEVLGIDFSHEFIHAANRLKSEGALAYYRKDSGNTGTTLTARIDADIDRSSLSFAQGDACNLPSELGSFDAVLLANVLCRLPEPAACLARMQGGNALVKPGGVLVMTTPFSWLPEYTNPSRWMNGVAELAAHLSEFELIHEAELPFMIREHQRKFEYIITKASVWRRRLSD